MEKMNFLVLVLIFLPFVSTLAQLPSHDIQALLAFKKEIIQDPSGYILDSWNDESIDFNGCPSSWNGIVCSGANVAGVVLNNLSLSANTDLSVFTNLTMLVKLSLSNNAISGKLSAAIGDFRKLQYLDISNNLFSETLPVEIGKLKSLTNLSLAINNFSGSVPKSIRGLISIQSLDLSQNSFSGALPEALTSLKRLVSLNLSFNEFTQSIPSGFEKLENLEVLDLHQNRLTGVVDNEFLFLSKGGHVDFSSNLLTSSSSQKLFQFGLSSSLHHLNLSNNQLTGSFHETDIPSMFADLKVLDLSHNQLSGELPGLNFIYDLEILRLSSNMFSGFIPRGLMREDSLVLTELDLSSNNLSGPIGPITSTTLKVLNLSSNSFSGELAALTGSCEVLDLSRNQISGNLSAMSHWGNNIEFLDISQNQLMGSFPEVTSQFLRLNHLNLSHNSLVNSLPLLLTQYPKLRILDLSFNRFDGHLLADLITSPTLQELHVHHNLLYGKIQFIPPSPNKFSLQILDLSSNHFNGILPDEFGVLTSLKILDIARNNFSGPLPSALTKLEFLISLDISLNKFTGPLLENLPDSLNSFNASYNDLSGLIPVNLRKFPDSSFHPGNSKLLLPQAPPGPGTAPSGKAHRKRIKTIIRAAVIVSCVIAVIILILLAIFTHYKRISTKQSQLETSSGKVVHTGLQDIEHAGGYKGRDSGGGALVISADDLLASRKGSSSEIISPDEKVATVSGYSPSKNSQLSWSPDSSDSFTPEHFGKLRMQSPDRLAGELHFLDDNLMLTPEDLSRAPAEVLGRSSHGTSYKAVLDNGVLLTVKWLREGLAKPKKEFAKEAKKFSNIRHPNVVGLRGYYWGPTQNEKLILSDYIAPGSLANFLYDRPGRKGPPLTWIQRLKIAVDIARGLNYLHFDRAVPHGNLKATNILLEGPELNARVANYCLHRLTTHAGTVEQILDAGVLGYRAPELASARKPMPSFKSDIYSFGVILLELLTGRCAGDVVSGEEGGIDLTDWVRLRVAEGHESDCFDGVLSPELGNPVAVKGMKEALGIALRCISPVSERPGIKSVYEDLSSI